MKVFTQTIAVFFSGWVLVGAAQAGPFTKPYPPAFAAPNQCQTAQAPVSQTVAPPLATPVSTPIQAAASQPAAPRTLPSNVGAAVDVSTGSTTPQQPRYCLVNHKLVLLSYEFKDVGPSGVSGVEVYYTRDGKGWQKFEGIQNENPVWVELEEGTFGIYLLARTGLGGGREAPTEGDQPQIWVQVDLTKPTVFLNGVRQSNGSRILDITWTARDDNFGRKPITLSYAEDTRGPWMPIAAGIENSGAYTWQIPQSTPSSFYVRVEAADMAGNVDSSTTPQPVKIDLAQPAVTNLQIKPVPPK
jgi:hypothetical protein